MSLIDSPPTSNHKSVNGWLSKPTTWVKRDPATAFYSDAIAAGASRLRTLTLSMVTNETQRGQTEQCQR